jgi:hypothetical protein
MSHAFKHSSGRKRKNGIPIKMLPDGRQRELGCNL